MSVIYESIGRLVVFVVRKRFGRQLQVAAGFAVAAGVIGAYLLASRDVEEG
ncbi:MAG: hypothetical protein H0V25_00065 [Solirubrobacterales bacterium]|nr:hypothetical protein [Solirubrobacterales bacterium]